MSPDIQALIEAAVAMIRAMLAITDPALVDYHIARQQAAQAVTAAVLAGKSQAPTRPVYAVIARQAGTSGLVVIDLIRDWNQAQAALASEQNQAERYLSAITDERRLRVSTLERMRASRTPVPLADRLNRWLGRNDD